MMTSEQTLLGQREAYPGAPAAPATGPALA